MCCIFIASKCLSWTVNRRLDEWVKLEQLDLDSVEAVVDEKVEDKVFYNFFFYLLFIFGNLNFCIQSGTFYSLKTSISWITMSTWNLFLFTWKLEGKKLCFLRVSAFRCFYWVYIGPWTTEFYRFFQTKWEEKDHDLILNSKEYRSLFSTSF